MVNIFIITVLYTELDLTGQPLECPFNINDSVLSDRGIIEKREEDDHCPLLLKEAR